MFYHYDTSNINFDNCIFEDLSCNTNHSIIHYRTTNTYFSRISTNNTIFKNIINNGNINNIGAVINCHYMNIIEINNSFVNISSPNGYIGGVFSIENQENNIFDLTGCNFLNIECYGNGGAIFTNNINNFTLTSCTFKKCESISGSGGCIYINNSGIFTYVNCKFIENYCKNGGNDIGHYQDLSSIYNTPSNIIFTNTCSFSSIPRISFSIPIETEPPLFGFPFIIIIFFS
jgi:hypothetical protein